ncbi:hypothetical protein QYM36_011370 [Artemia franciscana]|uniref:Uncharacterized protein n=1 Tax=Artemia franciscana TaxID=6661 RepID=A0AA88HII7_ARTSF|nr:hypothetical protein QYM36_011370 [Artemia franciscana]
MDQEAIVAMLLQTFKLSMEAMDDRLASFVTHFSTTVHAGEAAIQSAAITAAMSPILIAKFSKDGDINTCLNNLLVCSYTNLWDKSTWTVRLGGFADKKSCQSYFDSPTKPNCQHFGKKKPNIRVLVSRRIKNYSQKELKQDESAPRMIDSPPMPSIPDSPTPKDGRVDLPENDIWTTDVDSRNTGRRDERKKSRKKKCIERDLH